MPTPWILPHQTFKRSTLSTKGHLAAHIIQQLGLWHIQLLDMLEQFPPTWKNTDEIDSQFHIINNRTLGARFYYEGFIITLVIRLNL